MRTKRSLCILGVFLAILAPASLLAATITVNPGPNAIQIAIDAAGDGDEIVVNQGLYQEHVNFKGKNIVLRSTDPTSATVVQNTIIQGHWDGSIVTFSGTETSSCLLSGFSLTQGRNDLGGGGIRGNGTRTTISLNRIVDNNTSADPGPNLGGGAIHDCDGTITDNIVLLNISSAGGGGLYGCDGTIEKNVIRNNYAEGGSGGGGASNCNGVFRNNIFDGNAGGSDGGGGLYKCNGTIVNNLILYNGAMYGGGLYQCNGLIANNTIYGNIAYQASYDPWKLTGHGGGLYDCKGVVVNCIIWGNTGVMREVSQMNVPVVTRTSYSCVQFGGMYNGYWGGPGVIDADPCFFNVTAGAEDFHLKGFSPCINRGKAVPEVTDDYEGRPRPLDGAYDMGAFEIPPSRVPPARWVLYK